MGVAPKLFCAGKRINAGLFPPTEFVTGPMHFAVMSPAQRDQKFVTDFTTERAWLRESEVVGIRWLPAANQARAFGNPFEMHFISEPAGFWEGEHAFVDLAGGRRGGQCVSINRRRLLGSWG
jgi:hypothetical protein